MKTFCLTKTPSARLVLLAALWMPSILLACSSSSSEEPGAANEAGPAQGEDAGQVVGDSGSSAPDSTISSDSGSSGGQDGNVRSDAPTTDGTSGSDAMVPDEDGALTDSSSSDGGADVTDSSADAPLDGSTKDGEVGDAGTPQDAGLLSDGAPAACISGQVGCAGQTPEQCVDGAWVFADGPCSDSTPICINGACGECSPNAVQCSGGNVQKCDGTGVWQNTEGCADAGLVCVGTACVAPASCNGNQPIQCSDDAGCANYGGSCTYGCSNGACNCTAPPSRVTWMTSQYAGATQYLDNLTGLTWLVDAADGGDVSNFQEAEDCAQISVDGGVTFQVPTLAQVQTILSQLVTDYSCNGEGGAPPDNLFGYAVTVWTQTQGSCTSGQTTVVNIVDGTTSCVQTGGGHGGGGDLENLICVQAPP